MFTRSGSGQPRSAPAYCLLNERHLHELVELRTAVAPVSPRRYVRTIRVLRIALAAEDLAEAAALGAMRPRVPDRVCRRDSTPR